VTAAESAPAVELEGLTVRREGQRVLDGVSFSVAPASLHVLAGPNGAGKSTLLAAILGQISFEGRIRLRLREGGRVAFVPQRFHVDRTLPLSVLDFLTLGRSRWPTCLGVGRHVRDTIAGLLQRVGLDGFERRMLGALSGGELQRVLLANALQPNPELLLLDEPATGLDEASRARLDAELISLRSAGITLVMVSHDLEQIRRLADRVTLLDRAAARTGPPAEILSGSTHGLFSTGAKA
jgi:zinc transport system ATP-binding protein